LSSLQGLLKLEHPFEGQKEQWDKASHVGKDRRLHTKTLPSHVSLRGDVFYCYAKGCVCIENKIFL
jgi:hypothetical protein